MTDVIIKKKGSTPVPTRTYIELTGGNRYATAAALAEMVRQVGTPQYDTKTGLMQRGVQVRHLVLPGHAQESRQVLWYLYQTYGNRIGYSIMNQYTPMPQMREHPLLSRRVTEQEYGHVVQYAQQIGIENAFTQEGEAACESFIPEFSGQP